MTTANEARLFALRDQPGFAEGWSEVIAVLNAMAADGPLIRAGALLQRVSPEEILAKADAEPVDVTITGHSTLVELRGPLIAEFARHNLVARVGLTDYDGYLRELTQPPRADLLLCVLDPSMLTDRLPTPWLIEDLESLLRTVADEWAQLAAGYEGTLVLNTVPLLPTLPRQLVDHRSRARLGMAWREFNSALLGLALLHPHVVTVDLEPLLAAGGPVNDPRVAGYAKAYLGPELLARYAREVGHLARAVRGRAKKVLVLDLDGTLWDGVLAEDGRDGISAAGTLRGGAFERLQHVVKQLAAQGVLLAICSRNDKAEVLATLDGHPDMVLRADDFVAVEAGWGPKPPALTQLADTIGLDVTSFVFVDDNPTERGAVRALLPGVAVIAVDEEPTLHIERLLADGWFDSLELTEADLARTALYQQAARRRASAISDEDYLRELNVRVDTSPVRTHEIARVAQLTQRTNQFNLTAERLSPAGVTERVDDPDYLVLAVRSADRFGDDGLVGAIFARRRTDGLHIENMVLSCRVFGRGVEQAAISELITTATAMGVPAVHGYYRRTARNHRFEDFYPSLGFENWHQHKDGILVSTLTC
ncbi:MAG: HAD-IIIC family phosphatase [Kibdelosporangium sp.]